MGDMKRKLKDEQIFYISAEWILQAEEINKIDESETVCDIKRPVPNLDSIKYFLKFYPNSLKRCRVFLSLEMEESVNLIVNAKVTCQSANFVDHWSHIYKSTESYGSRLCLSEELFQPEKKFIVGNSICIGFEATLTPFDITTFPVKKVKTDAFLGLNLWENESSKDAKIVVDGKVIMVHQCVLATRSTIFDNESLQKREHVMPVSLSNINCNTVGINNYTHKIVEKAVKYCYDLSCLDKLSAEDAVSLLEFAQEFHMEELKKNVEELCIKKLSNTNACLFANSSITTKANELYKSCFNYLLKCMKDGTAVNNIGELDDSMQKKLFTKAFSST